MKTTCVRTRRCSRTPAADNAGGCLRYTTPLSPRLMLCCCVQLPFPAKAAFGKPLNMDPLAPKQHLLSHSVARRMSTEVCLPDSNTTPQPSGTGPL